MEGISEQAGEKGVTQAKIWLRAKDVTHLITRGSFFEIGDKRALLARLGRLVEDRGKFFNPQEGIPAASVIAISEIELATGLADPTRESLPPEVRKRSLLDHLKSLRHPLPKVNLSPKVPRSRRPYEDRYLVARAVMDGLKINHFNLDSEQIAELRSSFRRYDLGDFDPTEL
jgi:hypothetical protein